MSGSCEQARGTKSCAVIGYQSGRDGTVLPPQDYALCPTKKKFSEAEAYPT